MDEQLCCHQNLQIVNTTSPAKPLQQIIPWNSSFLFFQAILIANGVVTNQRFGLENIPSSSFTCTCTHKVVFPPIQLIPAIQAPPPELIPIAISATFH
jgi:hypothetical protein